MRSTHLILGTTLVACALALAAPAQARDNGRGHGPSHGWDRGHDRRDDRRERRDDRRDDRRDWRDDRREARRDWKDDRRDARRDWRDDHHGRHAPRVVYAPPPPRRVVRYYDAPRGGYYVPARRGWAVGQPYHRVNYGPTYVVNDYRPYGLRAPPRGYYWRRSDAGDFLLVAVATGIIADLILHH